MQRLAKVLLYIGIVAAVVGLSSFHARVIATPSYSYTGTFRFGWSLVYVGLLAVMAYGLGLPDVPKTPRQAMQSSIGASVGAALAMSVVQLFVGDALLPRFVVLGAALLLVPWYLICVLLANRSSTADSGRDRVLVIGDSIDPVALREEVGRSAERPTLITSIVPLSVISSVEGDPQPLVSLVERDRATVLVLDRDAQAIESIVAQAAWLHERGLRIRTLSLFYDEWLGMLPLVELERVSLMFDISEVHRERYGRSKRLVDLVVGLLACLVLVAAIPFVFVGNLFANRGPLFYRQERVGRGGADFTIYKFRSMRVAEPGVESDWTVENDPRITSFGKLLRKSHLDELPQAVNIVRGDLSVVGPRPEQRRYVVQLMDKLPFYDLRHLVRPGVTGWAQVKYGYAGDERDAVEKLQYEFYYLRHQNMALDGRIVLRTIRSVFGGLGSGR